MKPFVKGDIDGALGLGLDNVVQIVLIVGLCQGVLGFDNALVFGTILPGVAVSFLVGNLLYARAALKLAKETGRDDVCALPYGINTPIMIAFVFLVMRPAKEVAIATGMEDPSRAAWQAGLVACFACGVIELLAAVVADPIRRITPRVAMIATLGGIGLSLLGIGFLLESFSHPIVGIVTLGIMFVLYFGKVRFGRGLPGIAIAVVVGTALCWAIRIAPVGDNPLASVGLSLPHPVLGDLWQGFSGRQLLASLSIILPMGLLSGLASLQNIESAEAAGDSYPVKPAMTINGLGTIAAACFGSTFPMSIYIGHPGWKAVGARAGYSTLNGIFVTLLCLTGTASVAAWLIPVDAGLAIIIWIGLIISMQAFEVSEKKHYAPIVVCMLPVFGAWAATLIKGALRSVGYGSADGPDFSPELLEALVSERVFAEGAFAFEQGFLYASLIWGTITFFIIEREFLKAAAWSLFASAITLLGLMHSWKFTTSDTVINLPLLDLAIGQFNYEGWASIFPAWPYSVGYGLLAVLMVVSHKWAVPDESYS